MLRCSPLSSARRAARLVRRPLAASLSTGTRVDPTAPPSSGVPDEAEGLKRAERITKWGAGANVGMAVLKGGAGVAASSPAMIADAVHSLSDLVSDAVSLWTLQVARKPADADHPYGHGKFEAVGSACVGGLLVLAGGSIGVHALQAAAEALVLADGCRHEAPLVAQAGAAAVAAVSIGVKEYLFRATLAIGHEVRSSTLVANAWHHRTDALSSVVALAGLAGCAPPHTRDRHV